MPTNQKYVFVCGLHRSGTTLLASQVGRMKDCSGFSNTGALMDEGQFLQDVYSPDTSYGGVGEFGFAGGSHRTEDFLQALPYDGALRLRECWEGHWDADAAIRIEKTPSNILSTRFLQACFPNSFFVVVKRHPVAVSLATQKWSRTPIHRLFEHWLRCHAIYDVDKRFLRRLYEVRYEDYIAAPQACLARIAQFLGTSVAADVGVATSAKHNSEYFDRWNALLKGSRWRDYYRYVAGRYESRFMDHGYSLFQYGDDTAFQISKHNSAGRLIGRGAEIVANVMAPLGRTSARVEYGARNLRKWLGGVERRRV